QPWRAGGDSAVLVREAAIGSSGEVNEADLPAEVPMFEQLVGPDGHVLMTAHGPAPRAGSNAGVPGTTTRCAGCPLGATTLPGRALDAARAVDRGACARWQGRPPMSRASRLSILHTCWEGHPSGQTRVILDLARGQAAGGHRVGIACPVGSPLEQMVRAAGII